MTARVAVIGCGHWGRNPVRNFSTLGALACICDPDNATQILIIAAVRDAVAVAA